MVNSLDFDRFDAGQDLTGADGCIETHGVALQGLHVASRHSSRSRPWGPTNLGPNTVHHGTTMENLWQLHQLWNWTPTALASDFLNWCACAYLMPYGPDAYARFSSLTQIFVGDVISRPKKWSEHWRTCQETPQNRQGNRPMAGFLTSSDGCTWVSSVISHKPIEYAASVGWFSCPILSHHSQVTALGFWSTSKSHLRNQGTIAHHIGFQRSLLHKLQKALCQVPPESCAVGLRFEGMIHDDLDGKAGKSKLDALATWKIMLHPNMIKYAMSSYVMPLYPTLNIFGNSFGNPRYP